jgi:hypothetical protein
MMHPGCGGCDVEIPTLKWVSPASGKARIYGNARKLDTRGGWGVTVGIYHNYSMLWSQYIAYDDDIGYDFDMSLHVEEGDAVYFTVDGNCDNNYDTTSFDPIIILAAGTECLETSTGTGIACFTTSNGTLEDLEALPAIPPDAPAGVAFPHGMFSFEITGLSSGQEITLTVELPDPVPVGTKWWKYHNSVWSPLPIGDDDGDNIITVALKDGRTPDDEDATPGQITDQGGPGYGGAVGWDTYPVSKMRVLLPWIALFAAIAAGVSLLILKRRPIQN